MLYIQWGTCKSGTSATFPKAFTANPQIACLLSSGDENCLGILCTAISKTSFKVTTGGHGGGHWDRTGLTVRYIAIGY